MPPEDAKQHPKKEQRQEIVEWIVALREQEAKRNAGDPGAAPPRRLSNAEYDCTIRDPDGRRYPADARVSRRPRPTRPASITRPSPWPLPQPC